MMHTNPIFVSFPVFVAQWLDHAVLGISEQLISLPLCSPTMVVEKKFGTKNNFEGHLAKTQKVFGPEKKLIFE